MNQFILYCVPVLRRIVRPRVRPVARVHRVVRRGAGLATAAKIGGGAIAVTGLACVMWPLFAGPTARVVTAPPPVPYVGTPILPAGSVFGGYGGMGNDSFGGFGSPIDTRDYAALEPVPGVSVVPIGGPLVVLPGTDTPVPPATPVPEPSTLSLFASALAGLIWLYRRRKPKTPAWTAEDYQSGNWRRQ